MNQTQRPSVVRCVHYYSPTWKEGEPPMAAIITYVHSDEVVSLTTRS